MDLEEQSSFGVASRYSYDDVVFYTMAVFEQLKLMVLIFRKCFCSRERQDWQFPIIAAAAIAPQQQQQQHSFMFCSPQNVFE